MTPAPVMCCGGTAVRADCEYHKDVPLLEPAEALAEALAETARTGQVPGLYVYSGGRWAQFGAAPAVHVWGSAPNEFYVVATQQHATGKLHGLAKTPVGAVVRADYAKALLNGATRMAQTEFFTGDMVLLA